MIAGSQPRCTRAEQIKAQRILDILKVSMVDWEKVKKINTTLVDWVDKYIDDKEGLSESSTRSKRNLKDRIVEYLKYINKEYLPLNKVDKDFAKQASGNRTLYLEYYETVFRKRENLHLTLYPEDGWGAC